MICANYDCNQARRSSAIYSNTRAHSDSVIHCGLVLWQQELQFEISFKDEIKICPLVLTMA